MHGVIDWDFKTYKVGETREYSFKGKLDLLHAQRYVHTYSSKVKGMAFKTKSHGLTLAVTRKSL